MQILYWVAHDADSTPHPSCTAKMGIDPMFVTGPHGMGAHDKGDYLTLGNQPLAPATMPLYTHRSGASEPVSRN